MEFIVLSRAITSGLIDNRVRQIATLKEIIQHLHRGDALHRVKAKEENILFPMPLQTLAENEWAEIWFLPKYGWCLVEPQEGCMPPKSAGASATTVPGDGTVTVPTGHVTLEQLGSVLSTLPLLPFDLTFVDAEDRAAFFREGPQRIFGRSKAIIRREVQHCHPPGSLSVVNRILGDFSAVRHNVAEFWIDFHGNLFTSATSRFVIKKANA